MTDSPGFPLERVTDALRGRIADGTYPPGGRLPSETTLATEFNVARNTVRGALDRLRADGLIETRRPRGSFVTEPPPTHEHDVTADQDAFDSDGPADVAISSPASPVGEILGDELVLARRSVLGGDEPYAVTTLYVPFAAARASELVHPAVRGGENSALPADLRPSRWAAQDSVRGATADEAESLGIQPGAPVLQHLRIGLQGDRGPVCLRITVLTRGNILTYDL
jgi:DNA-binding GntR family transcriptional regulator